MLNCGSYPADQRCEHELLQQRGEHLVFHIFPATFISADMKCIFSFLLNALLGRDMRFFTLRSCS